MAFWRQVAHMHEGRWRWRRDAIRLMLSVISVCVVHTHTQLFSRFFPTLPAPLLSHLYRHRKTSDVNLYAFLIHLHMQIVFGDNNAKEVTIRAMRRCASAVRRNQNKNCLASRDLSPRAHAKRENRKNFHSISIQLFVFHGINQTRCKCDFILHANVAKWVCVACVACTYKRRTTKPWW